MSTRTAQLHTERLAENRRTASRRRRRLLAWSLAGVALVGVVTAMMLSSRPSQYSATRTAPGFALTSSAGTTVSLEGLRGQAVLLYPNEGVGCDSCFYQMVDIEKHSSEFKALGVVVLPLVMNPVDQLRAELARFKLRTPYLMDTDGSVSRAYGVLGKGMHAGLPGHGFVLIDAQGVQRWYGEYPSMYLSATELLAEIRAHLTTGTTS